MSYAWAVWAWVLSGVLHMVVGGYICYRFRAQIDALRAKVEPLVAKVFGAVWK